jgi:hypothetical protein
MRSETLEKYQQNIELQLHTNELDTRMLTIIVDRDKLLSIEILDYFTVKWVDSLGLATYSDGVPTIMSYMWYLRLHGCNLRLGRIRTG